MNTRINDLQTTIIGYDECFLYEIFNMFTSSINEQNLQILEDSFVLSYTKFKKIEIDVLTFKNTQILQWKDYMLNVDIDKFDDILKNIIELHRLRGKIFGYFQSGHDHFNSNVFLIFDALLDITKFENYAYDFIATNKSYGSHMLLINSVYVTDADSLYDHTDVLHGGYQKKYNKYINKINNFIF